MILDDKNRLFLSTDINRCIDEIKRVSTKRVVSFIRDDFLIDDAKEVIKEAIITSEDIKYILLAANKFNIFAQNSLLKVLEEPPENVVFLIVTKSKSTILPTIRSRVQIEIFERDKLDATLEFDLKRLDLKTIYEIIQANQQISKQQAKELIQKIFLNLINLDVKLDESQLENFSTAIRLLELNSRPINIVTQILLSLVLDKSKQT